VDRSGPILDAWGWTVSTLTGHRSTVTDLTKREYFAALFMAAIIGKAPFRSVDDRHVDSHDRATAWGAVCYADALLEELNR
jgi:hypothetical protein